MCRTYRQRSLRFLKKIKHYYTGGEWLRFRLPDQEHDEEVLDYVYEYTGAKMNQTSKDIADHIDVGAYQLVKTIYGDASTIFLIIVSCATLVF